MSLRPSARTPNVATPNVRSQAPRTQNVRSPPPTSNVKPPMSYSASVTALVIIGLLAIIGIGLAVGFYVIKPSPTTASDGIVRAGDNFKAVVGEGLEITNVSHIDHFDTSIGVKQGSMLHVDGNGALALAPLQPGEILVNLETTDETPQALSLTKGEMFVGAPNGGQNGLGVIGAGTGDKVLIANDGVPIWESQVEGRIMEYHEVFHSPFGSLAAMTSSKIFIDYPVRLEPGKPAVDINVVGYLHKSNEATGAGGFTVDITGDIPVTDFTVSAWSGSLNVLTESGGSYSIAETSYGINGIVLHLGSAHFLEVTVDIPAILAADRIAFNLTGRMIPS